MSFFTPLYRQCEPVARRGTRFRVVGPLTVNKMNVWRVYAIVRGGKGGGQVGPDHFTYESAVDDLKALVSGRRSFYFKGVGFERHGI